MRRAVVELDSWAREGVLTSVVARARETAVLSVWGVIVNSWFA
jgi:hypothetical protein